MLRGCLAGRPLRMGKKMRPPKNEKDSLNPEGDGWLGYAGAVQQTEDSLAKLLTAAANAQKREKARAQKKRKARKRSSSEAAP